MKTLMAVLCLMLAASAPAAAQAKRGKPMSEKQQQQQARFKDCTQRAHGHKGDERRQFMSTCLSK